MPSSLVASWAVKQCICKTWRGVTIQRLAYDRVNNQTLQQVVEPNTPAERAYEEPDTSCLCQVAATYLKHLIDGSWKSAHLGWMPRLSTCHSQKYEARSPRQSSTRIFDWLCMLERNTGGVRKKARRTLCICEGRAAVCGAYKQPDSVGPGMLAFAQVAGQARRNIPRGICCL